MEEIDLRVKRNMCNIVSKRVKATVEKIDHDNTKTCKHAGSDYLDILVFVAVWKKSVELVQVVVEI